MGTETLLLIAVILILIDIFLPTDLPTLIAYVLFSYIIARSVTSGIYYQIIIGIVCWWGMAVFHYYIWRKLIKKVTDRYFVPSKISSGIQAHFGKEAVVQSIAGKQMVKVEDELYPFEEETGLFCSAGDTVIVIRYTNEKMLVKRKF